MNGGDDGTRTRDLCRDRRQFTGWRTQYQEVTGAVVGNRWVYRTGSGGFCATIVQRPYGEI